MTSHPAGRRPPTRFSFRDVFRRRHLQEAPVGVTDDRNDPRLHHGVDDAPIGGQHDTYLVLSDRERQAGFVRPLRNSYRHVGPPGPKGELRDLTDDEAERHADRTPPYVKFEPNDDPDSPIVGRFWTQEQLDAIDKGCRQVTTMGPALAETYARDPRFYGATYCARCDMHRPVGEGGEFVWIEADGTDGPRVGT